MRWARSRQHLRDDVWFYTSISSSCSRAHEMASAADTATSPCGSTSIPSLSEQRAAAETTDDANSRMLECVVKLTEKSNSLGSSSPSTNSMGPLRYSNPASTPS